MGKAERPIVPSPEDFDPTDEEELAQKIQNEARAFRHDKLGRESAEKYGYPSIEAAEAAEELGMYAVALGTLLAIDAKHKAKHGDADIITPRAIGLLAAVQKLLESIPGGKGILQTDDENNLATNIELAKNRLLGKKELEHGVFVERD